MANIKPAKMETNLVSWKSLTVANVPKSLFWFAWFECYLRSQMSIYTTKKCIDDWLIWTTSNNKPAHGFSINSLFHEPRFETIFWTHSDHIWGVKHFFKSKNREITTRREQTTIEMEQNTNRNDVLVTDFRSSCGQIKTQDEING